MRVIVQTRAGERRELRCEPGENLLRAGLSRGIALPYECATGSCGTCKARLLKGRADTRWPGAPGHRVCREPDELLMCQSAVHGDCALEVTRFGRDEAAGAPRPSHRVGRLRERRHRTSDVVTFEIELDRPLEFHAGQFALLDVPGIAGARAFTMTNFEPGARRLSFVVKRKPGGAVSEWLFGGAARDGARLELFAPLGRSVFHRDVARHLVCIAGGSGIAGMLSILRSAVAADHFSQWTMRLFFGVRAAPDLFFLDELHALRALCPRGLAITVALSDGEVPDGLPSAHPGLAFARGRIDEVAWSALGDRVDVERADLRAYVAGPEPMVRACVRLLARDMRLPPNEIHYDAFN